MIEEALGDVAGGGGGGSNPSLLLHSFLHATTPTFPFGYLDIPIAENAHDYGSPSGVVEYAVTRATRSLTTQVTNAGSQRIIGGFYVPGDGDLPDVPAALAAYQLGGGAVPADAWDVTYSTLIIEAITGTDAGKYAYVGFDTSVAHPLSDFVRPGSDFHMNDVTDWIQRAGDITLTRDRTGWKVASTGFYTATLAVIVDFFFPE